MISIHLYGKLRRFAANKNPGDDSIINLEVSGRETLKDVLERSGIEIEELYTIFINSKLLATRTKMASHLGYQQANGDCHNWDLSILIKDGDRIGLFGRDMATLVV